MIYKHDDADKNNTRRLAPIGSRYHGIVQLSQTPRDASCH